MSIIGSLKAKYRHRIERKYINTIKRKQFNLTMAEEIVIGVKFIATILDVPQYVACEHILQVGSYHLLEALNDPEERQKLTEHLVKVHLLGDELKEYEASLIFGKN